MSSGRKKEFKVDLSHTIYDSLNIPEKDEEIVEKIKDVKKQLEDGVLFDEGGLIKIYLNKYIFDINTGLLEYGKSGNILDLLHRYAFVDIAMKRALLKDKERNGELSNIELNSIMRKITSNWDIIMDPIARAEYDKELAVLRRIQAIQNEEKRQKVMRNKLGREALKAKYGEESFDRSGLEGDKAKSGFDGAPAYGWSIREYPKGKELIFSTNTSYLNNHELDEKIEVYAHGEFHWGAMYRKIDHGQFFSPTYLDSLCEVVSIRKTDNNGNEVVTYGIAQTRDLGYFDSLTEDEIKMKEAEGVKVLLLSTPKEIEEREYYRRAEERRRRRVNNPNLRKPKTKENTLYGVKKFLNTIGFAVPLEDKNDVVKNNNVKPRRTTEIATASQTINATIPSAYRDPNKKYNVLVMQPVRYKLSNLERAEFAKTRFSDYMLVQAKEKNGNCFGRISDDNNVAAQRVIDETIRACQYASVKPGVILSNISGVGDMRIGSLKSALEYIEKRDKARKEKQIQQLKEKDKEM